MVAANTSYADFPRLLAFVARDGYAPKAFVTQGDRLVYNRGIIALALISVLVIWRFKADVTLADRTVLDRRVPVFHIIAIGHGEENS